MRKRKKPGSRVLPWAPGAQSHWGALGGDIEHRSELLFILQLTPALGAGLLPGHHLPRTSHGPAQ